MRSRRNVFLKITMAAAVWAWSGGVASAQCEGPCPIPGVVQCPDPTPCTGEGCPPSGFLSGCTGFYTASQKVNVFTYGTDNSIQIKFTDVACPFYLTVQLIPTTQTTFHPRVSNLCTVAPLPPPLFDDGVGAPEVTCNETVILDVGAGDDPTSFCAVYHVFQPSPSTCLPTTTPSWVGPVDYIVGSAVAKGNKHDYFLLRDPDIADTTTPDDGTTCFFQNITTGTLMRNYTPGTLRDPGLGGRACCPSDYVVARQKIRPVSK